MATATPKGKKHFPIITALIETFGFSPALATAFTFFIGVLVVLAAVWIAQSAPPRTIVLASGPEGSSFARWAIAYQKALAVHGVTVEILPTAGSLDNLRRLQATDSRVDVGFVAGGLTEGKTPAGLESLGSVAYQPLMIFYRGTVPIGRLAELAGKRIAIGADGSGTRALALQLLKANAVTDATATFSDLEAEAAAASLLKGELDAIFLMGDSAPAQTLRNLVRAPGIQLFDFHQADAYVRRYSYLNKLRLPEGSFDLSKNLPAHDVQLVGPTVELIAHTDLNSALSDLLLSAAQEVHGKAGLFQKRGEFPAALEHEFPLSEDAVRYYKSGQGILYRTLHSFWLANLASRILVAVVPLALVLIPALRLLPIAYRLNVRLKFFKCYRPLLRVERDLFGPLTPERVQELIARLDAIEEEVKQLKVPASFADQFYDLRVHVSFVRQRLEAARR